MEKKKNENIKPEHNVQIPMQVLLHPQVDTYSLKVFAYMKFRYQFFKLKGLDFVESNSTISEAIGVSRSKVIESINNLVELGFLHRQERHGKGSDKKNQTNIYTVMDILIPNGVVTKQSKKVTQQPSKTVEKPKPKTEVIPSWMEEDVPF
jgi:predicted transcriptional regulator